MEALTHIVAASLSRYGLDPPVDPRRLQWSRWSRCDSPHSLLVVPSKPGIFALAEQVTDLGAGKYLGPRDGHVETAALGCPAEHSSAAPMALAEGSPQRMLAVLQFSEDDNMAFVLDRMFTCINPMRARLASGCCFVRFVVIQDGEQRRSICTALNQWICSSTGKAAEIPLNLFSNFELSSADARVGRNFLSASANSSAPQSQGVSPASAKGLANAASAIGISHFDSGAAKNLHCSQPLPSGF